MPGTVLWSAAASGASKESGAVNSTWSGCKNLFGIPHNIKDYRVCEIDLEEAGDGSIDADLVRRDFKVCNILKVKPSHVVGSALEALADAQVEGKVKNGEEARRFVEQWGKRCGKTYRRTGIQYESR